MTCGIDSELHPGLGKRDRNWSSSSNQVSCYRAERSISAVVKATTQSFLHSVDSRSPAFDFSAAAIDKARAKARETSVEVEFLVDDLTRLSSVTGQFDLIVDYGTFDDLSVKDRAAYVDQVIPLAKPGASFLLWCFEWDLKSWERAATAILPFGNLAVRPGEIDHWFASTFEIRQIAGETGLPKWPRGWAAYLLTRI
jgi:SAM-dependent methyltransferase